MYQMSPEHLEENVGLIILALLVCESVITWQFFAIQLLQYVGCRSMWQG